MNRTAYILKREDGKYYYKGHGSSIYGWTDDFNKAFLFASKVGAKMRMYTSQDMKCKIVEVEIKLKDE